MIINSEFTDFIGVFDLDLRDDHIDKFIDYYKTCEKYKVSHTRNITHTHADKDRTYAGHIQDNLVAVGPDPASYRHKHDVGPTVYRMVNHKAGEMSTLYNDIIRECWQQYSNKYFTLQVLEVETYNANIQRTLPGQGYHTWHYENDFRSRAALPRVLASMMYLNDVDDGGETEFLYQSKRFSPKKGRVLLWPAQFTHTHRGNPPLSGEKYIITSWIETSSSVIDI